MQTHGEARDSAMDGQFNEIRGAIDGKAYETYEKISSEYKAAIKTLEVNVARHVKERETQIHLNIDALSTSVASSLGAMGGRQSRQGSGPGYFGDKPVNVKVESFEKLSLKSFSGESPGEFKHWRESLDLAMDSIWPGMSEVLEQVRQSDAILSDSDFYDLVDEFALKPGNSIDSEWDQTAVGRYLYRVLHHYCTLDALSTVKQTEQGKKGVEAYRLLNREFDKFGADTAAGMMADITVLGTAKCSCAQDVKKVMREMLTRTAAYEKRIGPLTDFRTSVLPGLALNVMGDDVKTHLSLRKVTGDFTQMQVAIDELLLITRSAQRPKKMDLSALTSHAASNAEYGGIGMSGHADWEPACAQDEEYTKEEWAIWEREVVAEEGKLQEQLNALGKGRGKGGKKGKKGKWDRGRSPAPTRATGAAYVETRSCNNCGVKGHLGRDCPLPDKRLAKGTAKILTEAADGAAMKPRGRICDVFSKQLRKELDSDGFCLVTSSGPVYVVSDPH